jgi:vitamin B12 transporter
MSWGCRVFTAGTSTLPAACPDVIDTARVGAARSFAVSFSHPFFRQSVLAAALLAVIAPAFADDASTDLDQLVVTATRTAQTQDQTLTALTVIDRADIERLQPSSVADLLRRTPGMSIANNGGPGKSTSLFLRGTESDHVLVLVDGIKLGSATSGTAAIQDIPVDQIERIEIVRGPFSSLYGSEAIGGVIQIFTRRPEGAFTPNASIGFGSYNTWKTSAGFAGRSGNGWYSLEATHDETDGINACRGQASPGAGCFVDEPDRDGYRNTSLSLQGGYRFNSEWDADARFFRAEGSNQYDGSTSNEAESASQVAGARVHYKPADNVTITASAGQSADLSDNYLNGVYSSTFNTHRELGSLQADIGAGGGLYSLGYDWQRDRVDSNTEYDRTMRINRGVFGQWQQSFGAQSLQASVRHDDDKQYGGKTTGSALWGWDFTSTMRLTASYGTAFKAPTFNDLYYPGYGNPNLKPETSRNVELGLRGTQGWGHWSLNAFQDKVDNLIAYDSTLGLPGNVDRAKIRGAEASLDTQVLDWAVRGSATWLDPRNDGDTSSHGNILPRRARQMTNIDIDRSFGKVSVGGTWYVAGRRYDDLANTDPLGGYSTTDLRLAYAFDPAWKVQLALNNVFDKRYETAQFYNQPGRNYMLTLRYRPAS